VRLSPLGTSAINWPIVPAPNERWWMWSSRWNEYWQGKPKYLQKTCPSATLSAINPTWPDLGSNPGRRGGKPATNRLCYGTAISMSFSSAFRTRDMWYIEIKVFFWTWRHIDNYQHFRRTRCLHLQNNFLRRHLCVTLSMYPSGPWDNRQPIVPGGHAQIRYMLQRCCRKNNNLFLTSGTVWTKQDNLGQCFSTAGPPGRGLTELENHWFRALVMRRITEWVSEWKHLGICADSEDICLEERKQDTQREDPFKIFVCIYGGAQKCILFKVQNIWLNNLFVYLQFKFKKCSHNTCIAYSNRGHLRAFP
jgi:hypothetical protein